MKRKKLIHFKHYEDKVDKKSNLYNIILEFEEILNDIFCSYSAVKGYQKFNKLDSKLPKNRIGIELQHVILGHGVWQARESVKYEMEECIEKMIKELDNS